MANNLGLVNQAIDGSTFAEVGDGGGVIKCLIDEVELDEAVAGTAINLSKAFGGKIKVVGASILHDALGTGCTLKLGDTSDDDAIIVATAAASAGILSIAIGQMFAELEGDELVLTPGGAASAGTVKVRVDYVNI